MHPGFCWLCAVRSLALLVLPACHWKVIFSVPGSALPGLTVVVTMLRGGPRRNPVPTYNVEGLAKALQQWIQGQGAAAFDFSAYNHICRPMAVSGQGLLQNYHLLQLLLEYAPSAMVHFSTMKISLHQELHRHHGWNKSGLNDMLYASQLADKILIMLAHCRRIKLCPIRYQQCVGRLSDEDKIKVDELLSMITTEHEAVPAFSGKSSSSSSLASTPSSRSLKREVSCDSDGYPCLISKSDQQVVQKEQVNPLKKTKRGPSGTPTSAEPPKPTGMAKSPAAKPEAKGLVSLSFGQLKVTSGTSQSYIQYRVDGKWVLLVAISKQQCTEHHKCIKALVPHALKSGLKKEHIVQLRDALLS